MLRKAFRDSKGREFFPGERVKIDIRGSWFPANSQGRITKILLTNDSEPVALVNVESLSAANKEYLFFLSDLEHSIVDTKTEENDEKTEEVEITRQQITKPIPVAAEKIYKTKRLIKN